MLVRPFTKGPLEIEPRRPSAVRRREFIASLGIEAQKMIELGRQASCARTRRTYRGRTVRPVATFPGPAASLDPFLPFSGHQNIKRLCENDKAAPIEERCTL
jgi:hypothetical protein